MVEIVLPDGSSIKVKKGVTVKDIASSLSKKLEREAIGAVLNGEIIDNFTPINEGGKIKIITSRDEESLTILRHSAAHILAKAVKKIYGFDRVKLGMGPAIENGFYYDFDLPETISEEDLSKIEEEMLRIVNSAEPFIREEVSRDKAIELFQNEPYKLEIIESLPEDETITIYWLGSDFYDLCKGPHVENSSQVKVFKLLSVSGAYWKGDPSRKMLQRIYGTAFWKKAQLDAYLHRLEEAKKRDHRILGKQLDLFSIQKEAGPGLVFWHPKGSIIRKEIEKWTEAEHEKRGYERIYTPHIMKADLWKTSGHYDFYREHMFFLEVEGEEYAVKPMNCPGHILVYKSQPRSYRDLPLRYFEFGTVYRYEESGSLHGLLRVRGFTQDDGHIFCEPDQLKSEIQNVIDYVMYLLSTFDLDYAINVGTRPEKSIGTDEQWEHATNALIDALKERGFNYSIVEGDGAFYGPKIDIAVLDALGRKWDGPTIQVDFNLPERFDIYYVDRNGERKRPVMVHRAIMGSIERFIGLLIEHYAGLFPLWLSPVQTTVIPVSDKYLNYAEQVFSEIRESGIRVTLDAENAKLGYKIRRAETEKVPYMVIVGKKEEESGTISVRSKREGDIGQVKVGDFIEKLKLEIEKKL